MDLATLTAQDYAEVEIAGLPYRVGPLTLEDFGAVQAWIKAHVPNPVTAALQQLAEAEAAGVDISPENRRYLLDAARAEARSWPPAVLSPEWIAALDDAEGGEAVWLWTVLRKHQPSLTAEQAAALVPAMTHATRVRLISLAFFGIEPPGAPGPPGAEAPKAQPPARRRRTSGGRPSTSSRPDSAGRTPRSPS
jgi:hypothetical protein